MARPSAAAAKHRQEIADGADLVPIGSPPRSAPARVRHWWRETAKIWPQLSRRDEQALLDYAHAMVELEDLRADVAEHGRFYETPSGLVKETPYYTALVRLERRLASMRRDFATAPGYRERAAAVRDPKRETQDEFGAL